MKAFTIPSIFTAVDRFSSPVNKMGRTAESTFAKVDMQMRRIGTQAFSVAKKSAMVGAAIAVPLIAMGNAAVDFEDKMADVGKTTGLSGKKLEDTGKAILNMSKTTRTSINDLVKIAEIGGQLGIVEKDLLSFTKSADMFNIALGADFSGGVEEAVSQVGKIKLLFEGTRNLNISDSINKTGSAINELGAVGAGTSANITDFTLRLGALPDALKPSIENTLALGTFLEELGIDAQIGAGGMTNFLLVAGKNIDGFASKMGISAAKAKALLKQDPIEFAKKFAKTFNGVAPEKMAKQLEMLGIGSQETIKVLGALGSGTERLTELQAVANKSFAEGTSLSKEAAKKNETNAAKMAKLKNNVQALGVTLGTALLPIMSKLVESLVPVIDRFAKWIEKNPTLVGQIASLAVKAVLLSGAISAGAFAVGLFTKTMAIARGVQKGYNVVQGITFAFMKAYPITMASNATALKAFNVATKIAAVVQAAFNAVMNLNPIFLIITGVVALTAGVYALSKAFDTSTTSEKLNNEVRDRALESSRAQRVEVGILFEKLRNLKVGTDAYKKTLAEVEAIQPGITEKYNLQAGAVDKLNLAEKELTKSLIAKAKIQAAGDLAQEKFTEAARLREEGVSTMDRLIYGNYAETINAAKAVELENQGNSLIQKSAKMQGQQTRDEEKSKGGLLSSAGTLKGGTTRTETTTKEEQTLNIKIDGLPQGSFAKMTGKGNVPKLSTTN